MAGPWTPGGGPGTDESDVNELEEKTMSTPTLQRPRGVTISVRPLTSTRGYWFGGVILVIGLIASLAWGVAGVFRTNERSDGFMRISIPGETTMRIERTGGQVIYYEGVDVPILNDVAVQVTDPAGRSVPVDPYIGDLRYDARDATDVGRAIATFDATMTGPYTITVRGVSQPLGRVAVGPSVAGILAPTLFGAAVVLLIFGGGGLALVIATAVRRSRDRLGTPAIPPAPSTIWR
jgi:hypothetical protein